MTIDDIDLVEINEAFAAQAIPSAKHLSISWDKLNVKGGARPWVTPSPDRRPHHDHPPNALEHTGNTFGLESMCVGGARACHDRGAAELGGPGRPPSDGARERDAPRGNI